MRNPSLPKVVSFDLCPIYFNKLHYNKVFHYLRCLKGLKHASLLFCIFLTKNNWGDLQMPCRIDIAKQVVPLASSRAKHVSTLFIPTKIVWFSASPSRVTFRQWSVINPVELVVRLADKTKPHTQTCDCFLFLEEGECEVILSLRFNYSEISSKHLTCSSSIAPFQGSNVDDEVAEVAVVNPTILRTN